MGRVLITGSSGYLGSSFVKLYSDEHTFISFSLLRQKLESISYEGLDVILHCAALVHKKRDYSYSDYYKVNVGYSLSLAKAAKEHGVKQFVFISSIAVYGDKVKKVDEYTTCHPVTSYGKSKLEAEIKLLELSSNDFVVTILRPAMIYGRNAPGSINSLLKLVTIAPIVPLGGIDNVRSFISIQNICHLINQVIYQKQDGMFLASDDELLSTTRLIEVISKNLGRKIYLIKIPFFEILLSKLRPSLYNKLYGSMEVDNTFTKLKLDLKNPFSAEESIRLMIKDE